MAKTESQISAELSQSITSSDATLDVTQGPIPDLFIRPQAGQLAAASAEAESLRQLFSLDFAESATDQEIQQALANFGSTPGGGTPSSHIQHFMRFARPTTDVVIPAGTLVSNKDGTLVYSVVTGGTISASSPSTFYNPTRRTYEIGLLVTATGVGAQYELPPLRVNLILTPVRGIDLTENRVQSTGGLDSESPELQTERLKKALRGRNLGGPGGLKTLIQDALPEVVTDVSIVQPTQTEFNRMVDGPALDIYVLGTSAQEVTETFTATSGQTIFPLANVPVLSLDSVTVNGTSGLVTPSLVQDKSLETGYSLRASDNLVVSPPLTTGDIVVVTYTYNKAPVNANSTVFGGGDSFLFKTDILLRSPFQVPPVISGEVRILPSYSVTEVETALLAYLATVFNFTVFTERVIPLDIIQQVRLNVAGVQSFRLTEFRRSTGSLSDVEVLAYGANEISVFDETLINVKVVA